MKSAKCLECVRKDEKIRELRQALKDIHKKQRQEDKFLKFVIADILRSINLYETSVHDNINFAKKALKELGGVEQYHNYPSNKKPERPKKVRCEGKSF